MAAQRWLTLTCVISAHLQMFTTTEEVSDSGRPSKDLPAFPGYPPEQKSLQEYVLACKMKFKRSELEAFIGDPAAEPAAMGRFKAVAALTTPTAATDSLKNSIILRNLETTARNAQLATEWSDYVRQQRNAVAALLLDSMLRGAKHLHDLYVKPTAEGGARYAPPHDKGHNGAVIWRAVLQLEISNAQDDDDTNKDATAHAEWYRDHKLPDNATGKMVADRLVDYTTFIEPYMDMPYTGITKAQFLIGFIPDALDADRRALLRQWKASGHIQLPDAAAWDNLQKEVRSIVASGHKKELGEPDVLKASDAVAAAIALSLIHI